MSWAVQLVLGVFAPLVQEQALHDADLGMEREHFEKRMTLNFELERRERIRDRWALENNSMQTLMIAQTVMWTCAFSTLTGTQLPDGTPAGVLVAFSLALSLSLGLLLLSMWSGMQVVARMSRYDMLHTQRVYSCGLRHTVFVPLWACHCELLSRVTATSFLTGTALLFSAAVMQMWATITISLESPGASALFVALASGAAGIVAVGVATAPRTTRVGDGLARPGESVEQATADVTMRGGHRAATSLRARRRARAEPGASTGTDFVSALSATSDWASDAALGDGTSAATFTQDVGDLSGAAI